MDRCSADIPGRRSGVPIALRSVLYALAKLLGDVNAIQKGKIAPRIGRRLAGKITGRLLGRLFR